MKTADRRDLIVHILTTGPDGPLTVNELHNVLLRRFVRSPESTLRLDLRRLTEAGRTRQAGVASHGAHTWAAVAPANVAPTDPAAT